MRRHSLHRLGVRMIKRKKPKKNLLQFNFGDPASRLLPLQLLVLPSIPLPLAILPADCFDLRILQLER